jgi:hypothetical protein
MLTARLVAIVVFAALLSAVPFHVALAATAPVLGSAGSFALLGGPAVSLTDSTISGDVGAGSIGGVVSLIRSTVAGTVHQDDATAITAYNAFLAAYNALAPSASPNQWPCTGSLSTVYTDTTLTLKPGVYCNTAAVTFTRTTLTLDAQGDPKAVWIFKIGTLGTGALTGTSFSVVMANGGQPCNVYWWVAQAAGLTTSNFKGNILAGAATSFTDGSLIGRALAKAAVTMVGPIDVFGCSSLVPPPIDKDYCKDYDKDYDKDHDKDYDKSHDKDYDKDHDKDYDKSHDKDYDKSHDKD